DEGNSKCRVYRARADRREIYAGVAVLVRQPDVRRSACEVSDTAAHLRSLRPAVAEIPIEADARRPHLGCRNDIGRIAEIRDRQWVRGGLIREVRSIEPDAICQGEIRAGSPLVARVHAKLTNRESRCLPWIGGIRIANLVELREARLEVLDAQELVVSIEVLD